MASPLVMSFSDNYFGNPSVSYTDSQSYDGYVEPPTESDLPDNFREVVPGVYRSSFPQPCHLRALRKLGLKTIITFVDEQYSDAHVRFLLDTDITHHRILIKANKDPTDFTPHSTIARVLQTLLDSRNHPILIHCNKGKHRTGCIVGCLRKAQGWPIQDILDEYRCYSHPKSRPLDEQFIMSFDHTKLAHLANTTEYGRGRLGASSSLNISTGPRPDEEQDSDRRHYRSTITKATMPDRG